MNLRPHLTYANVVSTVALLLALGGASAYAGSQLAARSVGERQLRPGAVTAGKLRKNAVTTPKIKALAIERGKLAAGAVDASKLATGAVGAEKLADSSVTTAKLAADAVTGEKVNEQTLGQVPAAKSAESATAAESANPAAFARVAASGSLEAAASKGIATVKREGAGVYCVSVASFTPKGAQVTPIFDGFKEIAAFARIGGAGNPCATPQVEVETWNGGVIVDAPFFAAFYR
jgi:hypothetical protein